MLLVRVKVKGDSRDPHEANTFGLPSGKPIRKALRGWFGAQRERVLAAIPPEGPLPSQMPPLAGDTGPMAEAMTPLLAAYWDEGGKVTRERLGLDPGEWRVTDPHLEEKIRRASLAFCDETNATTSLRLGKALDRLRDELVKGIVQEGESIPELTRRVQSVFTAAETWRANMIARTETARAVHAASHESARASGVVAGKKWLAAAGACVLCLAEAARPAVPLDDAFSHSDGRNPAYDTIAYPPLHPHDRCSITYVLTPEYERLLEESGPPGGGKIEPGPLGPEPKPRKVATPKAKPKPKPKAAGPILPGRPIGERIAAYAAGDEKVKAIVDIHEAAAKDVDRIAAERTRLSMEAGDLMRRQRALPEAKGAKAAEIQAQHDELQRQIEDIARKLKALREQAEALKREAHAAMLKALAASDPVKLSFTEDAARARLRGKIEPLSEANRKIAREAGEFVQALLARGDDADFKVDIGQIPRGLDQRAHYSTGRRYVNLDDKGGVSVAVHEIGHAIEEQLLTGGKKAVERSVEFLTHRVGAEPTRRLVDLFPKTTYRPDEVGRKDRFDAVFGDVSAYYVGKDYGPGATEILSMGIQKLYDDPLTFAKNDPEYCKYVLGLLDGSLR